jgi:hypothetical protein
MSAITQELIAGLCVTFLYSRLLLLRTVMKSVNVNRMKTLKLYDATK